MGDPGSERAARARPGRALGIAPLLLALALAASAHVQAEELTGFLEWTLTSGRFDQETSLAGFSSDTDAFFQRYSLNFDKRFYPGLRLQLGGVFETLGLTEHTQNLETESRATQVNPYADFSMRSKLFLAQLIFTRDQNRLSSNLANSTTNTRDTYRAVFRYDPERLPSVRFQFIRADTFDGDRDFTDFTEDRFQLIARWETLDSLSLYYRGERAEVEDSINDIKARATINSGRVQYDKGWWNRRLTLTTDYRITHQKTESLDQEAVVVAGLSALDDTPEQGPLAPNPALVDGNLSASAGINLGLPPPGGNQDLRNMGLDFASAESVNRLWVWVDRDLPDSISNTFIWTVYVSNDNLDWIQWQIIPAAPFDPFLHRFELNFPNTTARFIKAVTAPLNPTVPFASEWPEIYVTELQGVLTGLPSQADSTRSLTTEILNLDTRVRILETPNFYYELTYVYKESDAKVYSLRNGLSANHRFSTVYSVAARLAHETGQERGGDREALIYSASLAASAIETLRHSLVFSGRREENSGLRRDIDAVVLLNTLQFYPGIDMNLSLGKAVTKEETSQTNSLQINLVTTFVPHRKMRFNLTYDDRSDELTLADGARFDRVNRTGELSVAYNPLRTLYLFGSYRGEKRTGLDIRTLSNYSFSWTPFPEGTLELSLNFNETLNSDNDRTERSVIPRVRWNLNPRSYLQATYQVLSSESTERTANDNILSATLRLGF